MKEKTTQLIIDSIFNIVEEDYHSTTPLDYERIANKSYAEENTVSHVCENYLNCAIEKMHPIELCCWISAKEHMQESLFRLPEKLRFLGSKIFKSKPKVFCLLKSKYSKTETIDKLIKLNPLIENIELISEVNSPLYIHCIIHFLNSENLDLHINSVKDINQDNVKAKNKIQKTDSIQKQLTRKAIDKEKQYSSLSSNFKINEIKKLIDNEEKKRQETLDLKQKTEERDNSNRLRKLLMPIANINVKRIGINTVQNFVFTNYTFTNTEWLIASVNLNEITNRTTDDIMNINNISINIKQSDEKVSLMIMYNMKYDTIKKLSKNNTIKEWCKNPSKALENIEEEVYALEKK